MPNDAPGIPPPAALCGEVFAKTTTGAGQHDFWGCCTAALRFCGGVQAELLLQLVVAPAAHAQEAPVLQADGVLAPRAVLQAFDPIELHDGAAVDAKELVGIEPLFEHLHPLADHKRVVLDVQFGVRAAGRDEVDPIDGHDAHLPARVDADPRHSIYTPTAEEQKRFHDAFERIARGWAGDELWRRELIEALADVLAEIEAESQEAGLDG